MGLNDQSFNRSFAPNILRTALALAAFGLFVVGALLPSSQPAVAAAGINKTINFQGRLLTAAGAVVADGNYNMRFKVYQDGDGTLTGDTGGSGGALKWTEEYKNSLSEGVVVKNGYYSVALGTYCAFSGSACTGGQTQGANVAVDWNQDTLWLSMDVGGTTAGAITYDGELLPMRRMSSAVYALQAQNSNTLGGLTSSAYIQDVAPGSAQQVANINLLNHVGATTIAAAEIQQVASATAPVLIVKGGATPGAGADLLQFQSSAATLGRISSAGNLYVASSLDTQTGVPLLVGNANATAVTITPATTVTGAVTINNTGYVNTNSTTAFKVEQSGVKNNTLVVDTTNGTVGIGQAASASLALSVNGTAQVSNIILSSSNTANNLEKNYAVNSVTGVSTKDVVVLIPDGAATSVSDTTVAKDIRVIGVAINTVGASGTDAIVIAGNTTVNADTGAVAIGDQLVTSGTSGAVTVDNSATTGIVGYATQVKAGGSVGVVGIYVHPVNGVTNPTYTGLVTQSGGLTGTGTIQLNASGAGATTIGNSSAGATSIQGGSAGTVVNSTAGALTLSTTTSGNIGVTPGGTGDIVATLDADSNLQVTATAINAAINPVVISATYTGDVTSNATDISITDNSNASTGTLYGLSVNNADNGANTGVADAIARLVNNQATETLPAGLLIQNASGTMTAAISITNAATLTNALDVAGNHILGNTGIISPFGTTGTAAYVQGDLLYASSTTALSRLADIGTGSCLISGGIGANPSWGSCASTGTIIQAPGSTAVNTITPLAASTVGLTVNGTSNVVTGATALVVNQASTVGGPFDAEDINVTNGSSTVSNGLAVTMSGAGTLTNGITVSRTAGTLTNGLNFAGTMTAGILFGGTNTTDITRTSGVLSLQGTGGVSITAGTNNNVAIDSAGAGGVLLGDQQAVTIKIGSQAPTAARTTTLNGGASAFVDTVNIGTGATSVANGKTVNIANGTPTGAGTNTVNIGSLANASTTTIQAGTGDIVIQTNQASAGTIIKSNTTNSTSAFQIQNASTAKLLLADTTTQGLSVNSSVINATLSVRADASNATTTPFTSAGSSQSFVVPNDVSSITVTVWGGGGGGAAGSGSTGAGGAGGGAGFVKETLAVTPGETLLMDVGNGGTATATGGRGANGGGYSAVRRSATYLAQAGGGGGGGGATTTSAGGAGGVGGSATATSPATAGGNGAGTATTGRGGGPGSTSGGSAGTAGTSGAAGVSGAANAGGNAASPSTSCATAGSGTGSNGGTGAGGSGGAFVTTCVSGGGGGGGQFGGGGGGSGSTSSTRGGGGGGGGSNLLGGVTVFDKAGTGQNTDTSDDATAYASCAANAGKGGNGTTGATNTSGVVGCVVVSYSTVGAGHSQALNVQTSSGTNLMRLLSDGSVTFQNSIDSGQEFRVLDASGANQFGIDAVNNTMSLMRNTQLVDGGNGSTGGTSSFTMEDVLGSSATQGIRLRTNTIGANLESGGQELVLSGWSGANFTGHQDWFLTGFTTDGNIYVGNGAGTGNNGATTQIVLDKGSAPGSEVDGGMYYDTGADSFKCGLDGNWTSCTGAVNSQTGQTGWNDAWPSNAGAYHNLTSGTGDSYTIPAGDCQAGVVYRITAAGTINDQATWNIKFYLFAGATRMAGPDANAGGATDAGIAGSTNYQNYGWYMQATMTCYDSSTVFINGTVTIANGSGGSVTALLTSTYGGGAGEAWSGGSSNTLNVASWWNSVPGGTGLNTLRMNQFVVERMAP